MAVGQVRALKNYGWLANSAVWINLTLIFVSMGFVAHSPPNYAGAAAAYGDAVSGPVVHQNFVTAPLASKVNGIMNMVYAYGGAMIVRGVVYVLLSDEVLKGCTVPGDPRGDAPPVGLLEGHGLRAAPHLLRVPHVRCAPLPSFPPSARLTARQASSCTRSRASTRSRLRTRA
jgi:hypothetical protein